MQKQQWIPVTERLPEEDEGLYLVAVHEESLLKEPVYVARWCGQYTVWCSEHKYLHAEDITHWMPLPESPTQETTQELDKRKTEEPTEFITKNREGTDRIFTKVDGGYTIEGESHFLRMGYEEEEINFADFDGGQFVRVGFLMEELCKGCTGTITRIEVLQSPEQPHNWAKIMCWTATS